MTDAVSFEPKIDYNRGVRIRMHPEGFDVNMYVDLPGLFYDVNGNAISQAIALEAGFDVKHLQTLKQKRDRIHAAREAIEREYGEPVDEVVASAGGYTAVSLGNGMYSILDEGGISLITEPLARDEALALIKKLAPDAESEPALADFDVRPPSTEEFTVEPEAGKTDPEPTT